MAKRVRVRRRLWTSAEVKTLKALAGRKSAKAIARTLKRSEAAVRFKASMKRIRLAMM